MPPTLRALLLVAALLSCSGAERRRCQPAAGSVTASRCSEDRTAVETCEEGSSYAPQWDCRETRFPDEGAECCIAPATNGRRAVPACLRASFCAAQRAAAAETMSATDGGVR